MAAAVLMTVPAGSLFALGAGSAFAEPTYPPAFNQILASRYNVCVGGTVAFKAQTFQANSSVSYTVMVVNSTITSGTVTASKKGVAKKPIKFTTVGTNTVTFSGTGKNGGPLVLSANIFVSSKPPCSSGSGSSSGGAVSGASGGNAGVNGASGNDPAVSGTSGGAVSAASAGGLPVTGGQVAMTLLVGGVLVGLGALLLAGSRRRTH